MVRALFKVNILTIPILKGDLFLGMDDLFDKEDL